MFFESTLTDRANTGVFSLGAAAIKAGILAKFILIGDALGIGDKSRAPRLAGATSPRASSSGCCSSC